MCSHSASSTRAGLSGFKSNPSSRQSERRRPTSAPSTPSLGLTGPVPDDSHQAVLVSIARNALRVLLRLEQRSTCTQQCRDGMQLRCLFVKPLETPCILASIGVRWRHLATVGQKRIFEGKQAYAPDEDGSFSNVPAAYEHLMPSERTL